MRVQPSFKILWWNTNGLRNKINELRHHIKEHPINLILVQEMQIVNLRNLKIPNFKWFHTPHSVSANIVHNGGTAIYVQNRLFATSIPSLNLNLIENTNIKIHLCLNVSFTVSPVYLRPFNGNVNGLFSDIQNHFNIDDHVFLAGDWNMYHPG